MPRSDRKAIVIGVAASALIHAGVLRLAVRVPGPPADSATSPAVRAFAGTRLIEVVEVVEGTAPALPNDEPVAARDVPAAAGAVEDPAPPEAATPTVAARTAVQRGDGRLWRWVEGPAEGLSVAERVSDRIAARIAPFNDSIVPPQRAAERAIDWTVGADSMRWGYRPGFVYLAGRKRPFTIEHAGSPESAARLREFRNARFHLEGAHMRGLIDERARMLRQRADSVRAARRREGG